jgi:hypothetical protein
MFVTSEGEKRPHLSKGGKGSNGNVVVSDKRASLGTAAAGRLTSLRTQRHIVVTLSLDLRLNEVSNSQSRAGRLVVGLSPHWSPCMAMRACSMCPLRCTWTGRSQHRSGLADRLARHWFTASSVFRPLIGRSGNGLATNPCALPY